MVKYPVQKTRTPDINNKTIIVITIIMPVPKSGCSMISPNINITILKIGKTECFISFILLLVKYLDVNMIIPILANSLGCIPKEPIPNQLLEPFLTVPIPGISTSINKIIHIINIIRIRIGCNFRYYILKFYWIC